MSTSIEYECDVEELKNSEACDDEPLNLPTKDLKGVVGVTCNVPGQNKRTRQTCWAPQALRGTLTNYSQKTKSDGGRDEFVFPFQKAPDGESGFIFCDTYEEKLTNWTSYTIQDGWGLIHGCSYESEVCTTLSYELLDENGDDYYQDFLDIMVTKGNSCASNLDVPFDDREHHIHIESPVSSNGKDIGLPASKAFCVILVCKNGDGDACDKIKFRMKIATQACQGAAAVSSSASTNFLLTVFLTIIPLSLLL
jgi:hypothetical protein